ncbi:MAG: FAD:protein FMN transferase [Salinisphaeraceae bacterium]|nr:FAD:protein FMN transferase [Salinisphaeraceae bacterium]
MQQGLMALFAFVLLVGCSQPRLVELRGQTMGTTYSIKLPGAPDAIEPQALKAELDTLLVNINKQMSTYDPESDLSRINQSAAGEWVTVPAALVQVMLAAREVFELTNGMFDPTIGPLVNIWGFGPQGPAQFPEADSLNEAREKVGFARHVQIDADNNRIRKKRAGVYVDLSAIAKGYAVDVLAEHLAAKGLKDFMVEVGGELRVSGNNPAGKPWRLAIESPTAGTRKVHGVVAVNNMAVATSGDYRNFFEHDGKRYSHTIAPNTGYPVSHQLVSATVLHASAMQADALATALMVLGPEAGMRLAESEGLAVWLILRDEDKFRDIYSPEMRAYRVN